MTNTSRPRWRRMLALATGNWLGRTYLGVVAASVGVLFVAPDSPLAMGPALLTAPLSFLPVPLPFGPGTEGGGAVEVLAVGSYGLWLLVCALVNAAVVGALAERSASGATARRTRGSLLAPAWDNWLSRIYLAVVAVAVGFFLVAAYALPDPGFAGIWPIMATAPLSFVALMAAIPAGFVGADWLNPLIFAVGCSLAGLVNAVLLGRFAHRLSAGRSALAG
ncbi:hypothetical protein DI272_34545 [Streptomyces sp. Act143]|uniref:SCO4225 family membrane protein n=1 Tax=Streptomyces sp. Act143 TaxID=2200760 RepID=UPI000D677946|nr:hypothetical protein [Streptomyces sp. Act143]PWI18692.1 hypothetical protein DI272_34545 [Streptomyces sp. Act143]